MGRVMKKSLLLAGFVILVFGSAVALSADWLVIGAPGYDNGGSSQGSVFTFQAGTWAFEEEDTAAVDAVDGARFGKAVDVYGNYMIVGAPREQFSSADGEGAVYLFRYGLDDWLPNVRIPNPNPEEFDQFGWSVSMSGDNVIVGMPQVKSSGSNLEGGALIGAYDGNDDTDPGKAYIFK